MPARPCLGCGDLIAAGAYCRRCRPEGVRFNAAQGTLHDARVFRHRTLVLTGGRCARCGSTDRVLGVSPRARRRRPKPDRRHAAVPPPPRARGGTHSLTAADKDSPHGGDDDRRAAPRLAYIWRTRWLNQQTVRNWIDAKTLPALHVGRRVRIRRADFDALLAASVIGVPQPAEHLGRRDSSTGSSRRRVIRLALFLEASLHRPASRPIGTLRRADTPFPRRRSLGRAGSGPPGLARAVFRERQRDRVHSPSSAPGRYVLVKESTHQPKDSDGNQNHHHQDAGDRPRQR